MINIKSQFPIYINNPNLVYLDSAATTLKPQAVIDALVDYYTHYSANIHRGVYKLSERASEGYEQAREKVARFVGAKSNEIIFTSGTTAALNMAARMLEVEINEGDEIVVTELEHHSNLVPWQQLAARKGAELKYLKISKSEFLISNLEQITKNTKILAITHVSNVTGTVNPIKEIIKKARVINPEIKVVVDGAQAVAHLPVDTKDLDCDFYAFSGHKLYGPTGVGVLWVRESLLEKISPVEYGGGMIGEVTKSGSTWAEGVHRFEAGTPPIAEVIGLGAAVDFVTQIGFEVIKKNEKELTDYLIGKLSEIEEITIYSSKQSGIVSFTMKGVHPHDVASILDRSSVCVRSGMHCAMPLHEALGCEVTTRASLGIYNTVDDVDALVDGLREVVSIFATHHNG